MSNSSLIVLTSTATLSEYLITIVGLLVVMISPSSGYMERIVGGIDSLKVGMPAMAKYEKPGDNAS
ncbi:MAG: hypothetical protein QW272_01160 [Candidatus Methanomethylicaceae archaeon]